LHRLARYQSAEIKTPTESEIAFAGKKVFSSGESARYSGSLPPYCWPGSFGRKRRDWLPARSIKDRDLAALGEGHEKPGTIVIEKGERSDEGRRPAAKPACEEE